MRLFKFVGFLFANNGTLLSCKLLVVILVLGVCVPITDMVRNAILATDPMVDPIIGTSLLGSILVFKQCKSILKTSKYSPNLTFP